MRVQLLALVTLLSAFAVAQEVAPTLKGHRLGETIPEYFSMSTDADAGFVLNCLAGGKLPRLASESGVLSKKEQKKRAARKRSRRNALPATVPTSTLRSNTANA